MSERTPGHSSELPAGLSTVLIPGSYHESEFPRGDSRNLHFNKVPQVALNLWPWWKNTEVKKKETLKFVSLN